MAIESPFFRREYAPVPNTDQDIAEPPQKYIDIDGVPVQWEKSQWTFTTQEGEIKKDTYSIWNPSYHEEIARRFKAGELAAVFIAGCYGAVQLLEAPEWQSGGDERAASAKLRKVKPHRDWGKKFATIIEPDDLSYYIDYDRLPKQMQWIADPKKRYASWGGPEHHKYPGLQNGTIDNSIFNPKDGSLMAYWWPGHAGMEGLYRASRKILGHGILGGSSLNHENEDPAYTSAELYQLLAKDAGFLDPIDFIIFDELAESVNIQRSQSIISFLGEQPEFQRIGGISPDAWQQRTNLPARTHDAIEASSSTEYAPEVNAVIDQNITKAEALFMKARSVIARQMAEQYQPWPDRFRQQLTLWVNKSRL